MLCSIHECISGRTSRYIWVTTYTARFCCVSLRFLGSFCGPEQDERSDGGDIEALWPSAEALFYPRRLGRMTCVNNNSRTMHVRAPRQTSRPILCTKGYAASDRISRNGNISELRALNSGDRVLDASCQQPLLSNVRPQAPKKQHAPARHGALSRTPICLLLPLRFWIIQRNIHTCVV